MRLITTWPNPENKMEKNPKSQRTVIKAKKIKATTKNNETPLESWCHKTQCNLLGRLLNGVT